MSLFSFSAIALIVALRHTLSFPARRCQHMTIRFTPRCIARKRSSWYSRGLNLYGSVMTSMRLVLSDAKGDVLSFFLPVLIFELRMVMLEPERYRLPALITYEGDELRFAHIGYEPFSFDDRLVGLFAESRIAVSPPVISGAAHARALAGDLHNGHLP